MIIPYWELGGKAFIIIIPVGRWNSLVLVQRLEKFSTAIQFYNFLGIPMAPEKACRPSTNNL